MKHRYCLPPCPSYDVAGMEDWLEAMAQKGWLLEKDGIFAGVGSFVSIRPQRVKYRLAAALKSTSMWAEDGGEPDPEAVALSEMYGWEYAGRRGEFYIYRTFDPAARELHTDPAVQALALRAVEKRRRSAAVSAFLWLVVYPLFTLRGGLLLAAVHLGTTFVLFTAGLALWLLAGSLAEIFFLSRLRKQLLKGALPSKRHCPALYHGKRLLLACLVLLWISLLLHRWSVSVLDEDKLDLTAYGQDPPFATMLDFAGGGDYRITLPDKRFHSVKEWQDLLAPRNIQWAEHAQILQDGSVVLEGGLRIDYHETVSPRIAAGLAQDYCRQDERGKHFAPLDLPPLDLDFAIAYRNGSTAFPTVVLRQGSTVLHATFYQFGDSPLPLAQWAGLLADSIRTAKDAPRT